MISGSHLVVLITASNKEEGEKIANELVKNKLAACVNIVDNIKSIYWWKGNIDSSNEVLLIVKTKADKFNELVKAVKDLHSYEVPEIIAIPIILGYSRYLEWIDESISSSPQ